MKSPVLQVILIAAVVVRFALLASAWNAPHRLLTPDSVGYAELSESLTEDATFSRGGEAEVFRTPGYPVFLLLGRAFGKSWRPAVAMVQILLDVLLVYLTFRLGWLLCSKRVGLWAAAAQAVTSVSIAAGCRILSDGLFAAALTLTMLFLAHHFKTSKWWSLVTAACLAALGCYVRPIGLAFCLLAVIVLLLGKRRIRRAAAFAAIVAAAIAPWFVRNYVMADYVGFSSFASDSMYYYSAPSLISKVEGISLQEATGRIESELAGESNPTKRRRRALEIVLAHPGAYAGIHLRGSLAFWLPGATDVLEVAGLTAGQRGTLAVLHERGLIAAARHYFQGNLIAAVLAIPMVALLAIKYFLAALCAISRLRFRMAAIGWLIMLTILTFALVGGPAATPRFRVAVAPLLSLAAGVGIVRLLELRKPPADKAHR